MAPITLQNIAPEIENEVRKISKAAGKPVDIVVQEIICEYIEHRKKPSKTSSESLRKLAGGWSEKEASSFMDSIKSCEQIDENMWT